MGKNNNFENVPYAEWLEETLQGLIDFPAEAICISAVSKDGDVYTRYYNTCIRDKILIAGVVQQEATVDILRANGVFDYADTDDDYEEEDEDD